MDMNYNAKSLLDMKLSYYYGGKIQLDDTWNKTNIKVQYTKLYYVLRGRLKIVTDSEVIVGTPNTLILMPAGLRHDQSVPFPDPAEKLWMHFNIEIDNKSIFDSLPVPLQIKVTDPEKVTSLFYSIFECSQYKDVSGLMMLQSHCFALISYYLQGAGISHPFYTQNASSSILKAAGYMQDNLAAPPSVTELASMFHFNTSYFIRIFRKHMGLSPHQYITHLRMERAKNLLENSNMTIARIARSVGYDDAKHFSKAFKNYTHYSPTMYREINKNKYPNR